MRRLVSAEAGTQDGRQRLIRLTDQGRSLLPKLVTCWEATAAAAATLEAQCHLSETIDNAIDALGAKSFGDRIREARMAMAAEPSAAP